MTDAEPRNPKPSKPTSNEAKPGQRSFRDQLGRDVRVAFPPRRIVSLVPSQTELLFDLGAGDRVVGATRFCIHPEAGLARVARVGGTKRLDMEKVAALEPDLVIGNKEENEREQIEALARHWPTWLSDVRTLDDALDMIRTLGELLDTTSKARALADEIDAAFATLPRADGLRVAYLIWRKPWMAAGSDTFIDDLLGRCGFVNVVAEAGLARYPELSPEALRSARPDVVLLSSEPFPFARKHAAEVEAIVPGAAVQLVDGEAFSWFGSRLLPSTEVLGGLVRDCTGG